MGIAHVVAVFGQLMGERAVIQPFHRTGAGASPTAEMNLINAHGLVQSVCRTSTIHPLRVIPLEGIEVGDDIGGLRRQLGSKSIRITLVDRVPMLIHAEFVFLAVSEPGNEQLPDSAGDVFPHGVAATIPVIEVAHNIDAASVRCPNSKVHARHTIDRADMCA